jgi:hypothetical protein
MRLRGSGMGWHRIGEALGIPNETVRRFSGASGRAGAGAFVPVVVSDGEAVGTRALCRSDGRGSRRHDRLSTSELALFIEGCTLIGKKSLSPTPISRNDLALTEPVRFLGDVLDIEHESDIERLRQLALLQKSQLEQLVAMLARKCAELQKFKGSQDELQLTLKLLEDAQKQVVNADQLSRASGDRRTRDQPGEPQRGHGPTEQLSPERVQLRCELDDADHACPSAVTASSRSPASSRAQR